MESHTDFVIGAFAIEAGWKLNAPFPSSIMRVLPTLSLLWTDIGLHRELESGPGNWSVVDEETGADPYRLTGKFSSMGDKAMGS